MHFLLSVNFYFHHIFKNLEVLPLDKSFVLLCFFPQKIFYFLSFSCKFPLSRSLLKGINLKNTISTIDNTGNMFPLNNYLTKPLYAWFCCYIFAPFQSKYLSLFHKPWEQLVCSFKGRKSIIDRSFA